MKRKIFNPRANFHFICKYRVCVYNIHVSGCVAVAISFIHFLLRKNLGRQRAIVQKTCPNGTSSTNQW